MSTDRTTSQKPAAQSATTSFKIGGTVEKKQPVIEKIDIAELQIDESFDGDFDPYNSTGQFLADALKKKYDE